MVKKICLLFIFLYGSTANADILNSFDIAENLQKKYSHTDSFSADITQTLAHSESHTSEIRKGNIYFKKPDLFVIETAVVENNKKIDASKIIVSKDYVWVYIPDEGVAYKYNRNMLKEISPGMLVLTGQNNLLENFSIEDNIEEGGMHRLILLPNEPSTQIVKAIVWIDKNDEKIVRIQIEDFYENLNDISLFNIDFDKPISDKIFDFTPPENIMIEDHTKEE